MYNRQLIIEDGTVYPGYAFGDLEDTIGEVVFNTAMTGYQETLSDPSYNGQIITFTYPLIGNYGINKDDYESMVPCIKGMVVRELCKDASNFRNQYSLDETLKKFKIPGISGIDTRSLTKKLRHYGVVKGAIVGIDADTQAVIKKLKETQLATDQISQQSTKQIIHNSGYGYHVVLVDLGTKSGIQRELEARGCRVTIVPHDISASQLLALNADGVMLSNGPGDPEDAKPTIAMLQQILNKLPIFGICMGHQLLALAGGATTYKLKFGHRGCNHPVKNLITGKIDITSQNHGYAVSIDSLENTDFELTHLAVNDNSCEGIRHKTLPVFSVQYHPEAAPGPVDSQYLFDQFISNMQQFKK